MTAFFTLWTIPEEDDKIFSDFDIYTILICIEFAPVLSHSQKHNNSINQEKNIHKICFN